MQRRVGARGIALEKTAIVPNWADTSKLRPLEGPSLLRRSWGLEDRFVVMYSGNMGLSQNLDPLIDVANALKDLPIAFVLIGEGAAKEAMKTRAKKYGLSNVHFLPYQPKENLSASLTAADVHLIPLRRGLAGYIVPSKLYGILSAGMPYIAAVDEDSEVASVTRRYQCGLRIEPDSAPALTESLHWCIAHRSELSAMGSRGRELAETRFDRSRSVALFTKVLEECTHGLQRK